MLETLVYLCVFGNIINFILIIILFGQISRVAKSSQEIIHMILDILQNHDLELDRLDPDNKNQ